MINPPHTPTLVDRGIPALIVIGLFIGGFMMFDRSGAAGTFHTQNLVADNTTELGSAATGSNTQVLSIDGPWQNQVHVTNANSEIFTQILNGTDHDTSGDVCGVVVRNHVNFDTTAGPNQSCGAYFETTASRSHGANALINYGVRGHASGGTQNYGLYCDAGSVRCDDGAFLGPIVTTGNFLHSAGTFNIGGATTIDGDTHITSHGLVVDTSGEFGTSLLVDGNLRVNGSANLAGGSGLVFLQSINSSGIPIPISNAIAPAIERISGPGASDPTLGTTTVTGLSSAITLADGTKDGQLKMFSVKSGTGTITPLHLNGGTVYTWSSAPATLTLVWDATSSTWDLIAVNNMLLS